MFATPRNDSTMAGRAMWYRMSPKPTSSAAMPIGARTDREPPSATPNTISASRAQPERRRGRQNVAIHAHDAVEQAVAAQADATPSTKPSTPENAHAQPIKSSELPARHAITSATGALKRRLWPISPCNAAPPIRYNAATAAHQRPSRLRAGLSSRRSWIRAMPGPCWPARDRSRDIATSTNATILTATMSIANFRIFRTTNLTMGR